MTIIKAMTLPVSAEMMDEMRAMREIYDFAMGPTRVGNVTQGPSFLDSMLMMGEPPLDGMHGPTRKDYARIRDALWRAGAPARRRAQIREGCDMLRTHRPLPYVRATAAGSA